MSESSCVFCPMVAALEQAETYGGSAGGVTRRLALLPTAHPPCRKVAHIRLAMKNSESSTTVEMIVILVDTFMIPAAIRRRIKRTAWALRGKISAFYITETSGRHNKDNRQGLTPGGGADFVGTCGSGDK